MRLLAIGDPHGSEKVKEIPLKGIDAILITGDLGKSDLMRKYAFAHKGKKKSWVSYEPKIIVREAFLEAYNSSLELLRYLAKKAPVYLIYGNVEESDSDTKKLSEKLNIKLPLLEQGIRTIENVHIINNRKVNLEGIAIAGSQFFVEEEWVKRFSPDDKRRMKRAKKETAKAKKFYSKLGYVDILLCHQPPYGILDKVTAEFAPKDWQGKHAGSKIILDYIRKHHPRYVICGHIHEGKGSKSVGNTEVINIGVAGDYSVLEID